MQTNQITVNNKHLTVTDMNAVKRIRPDLQKYIVAKNSSIIRNLKKSEACKFIYDAIAASMEFAGMKVMNEDHDVITNLSDLTLELVYNHYSSITSLELKNALKEGAIGNYGEYFGYNLKSINVWIKTYMNSSERNVAMKEWSKAIDEEMTFTDKPTITLSQTLDSCRKAFEEYKKTKMLPMTPFAYYNLLWKDLKIITWTNEERKEIVDVAKKEYFQYLNEAKNKRLISKSDWQILIDTITHGGNPSFDNVVKKVALKKFFDNLISKNNSI